MAKSYLGKVFISYSSGDRDFVIRMNHRIKKSGYQTWLDMRELLAGDVLSSEIAAGVCEARVVVVVVSDKSVNSKWLKYEVSLVTPRMVAGECRVIAALIDDIEVPAELSSLVYADFRASFDDGIRRVRAALREENERAAEAVSFGTAAGNAILGTFGGQGHVLLDSEYSTRDYDVVHLSTSNGKEIAVVFEVVPAHGSEAMPLSERWWSEFSANMIELPERLFLLVTERPVEFETAHPDRHAPKLSIRELASDSGVYAVVVDCHGVDRREWKRLFEAARKLLEDTAATISNLSKRAGSFDWSSGLSIYKKARRR